MPNDIEALMAAAAEAQRRAYAPYSGFAVGAAVRGGSGRVFSGCNVENVSYSLSSCAERNAIASAVAAGETHIDILVLLTPASPPAMPCGACRQVMQEFGLGEMRVIAGNPQNQLTEARLADLLPQPFTLTRNP